MGHDHMSDDQKELRLIAAALEKRIADLEDRVVLLREERIKVLAKITRLETGDGKA